MKVSDRIRLLYDGGHVELVSRAFEHNGHKGVWTYATRRVLLPFLGENKKGLKATHERVGEDVRAVIIVAMVLDMQGVSFPYYVLNKEFRVPLVGKRPSGQCWEIAFPAGLIDKGETPEQAAIRELAEETPYKVVTITDVSPPLASSSGITDEMVHIVRCRAELKPDGATAREASEDIETFLAKDTSDPRIPKGEDVVWSVRAWLELDEARRRNFGFYIPGHENVKQEHVEFSVWLAGGGPKPILVIKEVRDIAGLWLKDAKDLVMESFKTTKLVKDGILKEEAASIKSRLEAAGGIVEVR